MSKSKLQLVIVLVVLFITTLACGVSASTANIQDAKLAKDYDGNQPGTVFTQDEIFYCVVELANAPDDTTVKASWAAVAAEGVDPNFAIDETELTSGSGTLHFQLSNDNLWPKGKYKVDIYLNGELDRTLEFEVQ